MSNLIHTFYFFESTSFLYIAFPVPAYKSYQHIYDFLCITVAAAWFSQSLHCKERGSSEEKGPYLMVREYQSIRKHDILPPTSREDNNFSNVVWR